MCKKILFPAGPVIEKHGGVEALSKLLGYKYQRVHNWISRGIPALEIALRPEIFIVDEKVGAGETAQPERQVA